MSGSLDGGGRRYMEMGGRGGCSGRRGELRCGRRGLLNGSKQFLSHLRRELLAARRREDVPL